MRFGAFCMSSHLALDLKDIGEPAVFQAVSEVGVRAVSGVRDQRGGPQADADLAFKGEHDPSGTPAAWIIGARPREP